MFLASEYLDVVPSLLSFRFLVPLADGGVEISRLGQGGKDSHHSFGHVSDNWSWCDKGLEVHVLFHSRKVGDGILGAVPQFISFLSNFCYVNVI